MSHSTVGDKMPEPQEDTRKQAKLDIARRLLDILYAINEKSRGNISVDTPHQISENMEELLQLTEQIDSLRFKHDRKPVQWPWRKLTAQQTLVLSNPALVPQPTLTEVKKSPCLGPYREHIGHIGGVYFGQYSADQMHGWGTIVGLSQQDLRQWLIYHGEI